ncbi:MAG: glycoside hydrolase family 16 protein [Clostridia bacterium]|nr:glycoside hydrolase family 16 protein [Clostridia bacterium]
MFELLWSEDFSTKTLDDEKWNIASGGHGFGNNEDQFYTTREKNVRLENNQLIIEAHKEVYENRLFTSGKVTTSKKFSMTYGKVEVKAKIPKGKGTWPAIWMLPEAIGEDLKWPRCGEIDIMEHVGRRADEIHFSLHSELYNHVKKTQETHVAYLEGITDRFALYGFIWTPEYVEFQVDHVTYARFEKKINEEDQMAAWPFDQPFYLILNLAIGGYFGGEIDDQIFPVKMIVDNIQVFKLKD